MSGEVRVIEIAEGTEVSAASQETVLSKNFPDIIDNVGLKMTVNASAATIALTQKDGSTDPTATDFCQIGFRSLTITTGGFDVVAISAALNIVIPSTATLDMVSGVRSRLYIYGINNSGTGELAVGGKLFSENEFHDTIAISTGSDSADFLYSTVARTGVPIKLLGHIDSKQATAGTWASTADEIFIGERTERTENAFLPNFRYLDESHVYTTTDFFGNHMNESSFSNGGTWIGGENLSQIGSITTAENHLGQTVACDLDGTNDIAYYNGTDFDTADEDFFQYAMIQMDAAGNDMVFSKRATNDADKSYIVQALAAGGLKIEMWYDNAGNAESFTVPGLTTNFLDGKFHFLGLAYDQSANSITIYHNNKIAHHFVSANLATRNNSASCKVAFGGEDPVGTPSGFLDAKMPEVGYSKIVPTFDQVRELYVAMTKKKAYIDENGEVQILGETEHTGENGYIQYDLTVTGTNWTTTKAIGVPYSANGAWRLRFNIKGTVSVGVTSLDLTIAGTTYANTDVAISGNAGVADWAKAKTASPTAVRIECGASATSFTASGDVELTSKPTWAY